MAITRKINSKNRSFWEAAKDARSKIETWPRWKRNLKVTKYSAGFDSESFKSSISGNVPVGTKVTAQ